MDIVICYKCKKHFSEGFNFCPHCGTKNPIFKICVNCKYKTFDKEFMFCPKCGKKLISEIEYEFQQEIKIKKFLRKEEERKKEIQKKTNPRPKNISSSTVSAETYRKMKNVKITGKAKYGW